jgi:iron complex transport system ATP-binding protein
MDLLTLDRVTVLRGSSVVLRDITWTVRAGERWVVVGPNGAGKTTLAQIAALALPPDEGRVELLGQDPWSETGDPDDLAPSVGLCSASVADLVSPEERVLDLVMTGAWATLTRGRDAYGPPDEARARGLLMALGASTWIDRAFGSLSAGERQRIQVARALMSDPELLVLDEPAAGLDLTGREALVNALGRLAADSNAPAQILITHHVEEIPGAFTHAMLLRAGEIVSVGPLHEALTERALEAAFAVPVRLVTDGQRFAARAAPSWGG